MKPVKNLEGPKEGVDRVYRGGSWHSASQFCRAASRYRLPPVFRSSRILGFRFAFSPPRKGRP